MKHYKGPFKKRSLAYLDIDKYLVFIKNIFESHQANFYLVTGKKKLETQNGTMYVVKLDTDLNDPNLEPIAEAWINGHLIFMWREKYWLIATDNNGKDIYYTDGKLRKIPESKKSNKIEKKIVCIYEILPLLNAGADE